MSVKQKVVNYKHCLVCGNNKECKQEDEQLQICFFYNRNNIKNIDDIFSQEFIDNIKFHILWFLDNKNCDIALTKAKDLSKAVDKIIDEIKASIEK